MSEDSAVKVGNDAYFGTEHLRVNLGGRSARGGAVAITTQGLRFVLTLGATSVLGRLLTPEDYGLIGMVAFVTAFVSIYKDLGLGAATIQQSEITFDQVSTLFWVNVSLSIGVALVTVAISPLVSWFYREPRLTAITLLTAVGFVISGLAVQHEALLRRQMRYFALATINLTSLVIGYIVGIGMAWKGFQYWALVCSQLAVISTGTAVTWIFCRWRPGLPKKDTGVRSMLRFGGNFTGFSTVNFFARNIDNLLIGKFWGAQQLGIYGRAYQLMMLPIEQINEPISSVAIPTLSRLTDDDVAYRRGYLRMLEKVALLTMPGVALMIVTSDWVIAIVLGSKWREVGPLLTILGIAGLIQPLSNTTGWLLITQARTSEMFRLSLMAGPITIASIVAGLPWGAIGVATSYVTGTLILTHFLYWFVGRRGPVRTMDIYRTIAPFAVASLTALGTCLAFRHWLLPKNALNDDPKQAIVGLIACGVVTVVITILVLAIIPAGRNALRDAAASLRLLANKKKN
jgi:O-antigen/teichoic acid export membrane protein